MSSNMPQDARAPPHIRINSGSANNFHQETPPIGRTPTSTSSNSEPHSRTLVAPGPPPPTGQPTANGLYTAQSPVLAESAERLLPPSRTRTRTTYREEDSPVASSFSPSAASSRRTSWSSDAVSPVNPFDDDRSPSRADSDDDNLNTQTVSEKYNILPSAGLLLFPEDVEKDDWLHNPDPKDKDGEGCDNICSKRGIVNVGGLAFITLGVLFLFIGFPIITFVQDAIAKTEGCSEWNCLNVGDRALLSNIRSGLIDPDTPDDVKTMTASDGSTWKLVFSDEFNTDGRTFYDEDDPYFQAVDIWYGVTEDLEWYDPDAATTEDGVLKLRFDAFQNHNLNYRSGMLQSWNKLCFTGGRLEASISLPGRGDTIGFWPGFWAMGNLGRPGYAATTDGLWPYTYEDICDAGITANQSSPDGISQLPGMRLPACTCSGADHPNAGKSRSAPEIDVIEATVGHLNNDYSNNIGVVSQSFQCAPFDIWYAPDYDFVELYDNTITMLNTYRGGTYQQAFSAITNLNNDWYDGNGYQVYAFEYEAGEDGWITWFVGEDATWKLSAKAVGPNGNIGQRTTPQEPMTIIMNFGMSNSFSQLNLTGLAKLMPATMRVDYIRIYQDPDSGSVTCDPDDYPTTDYISDHPQAYENSNLTLWSDTDYDWPKNSLVDGCTAEAYSDD